jgi:hypothetical protein
VTDDPNHLDPLLEQLGGEREPDPIVHLTSGTLSAYAAKKLPPEEELQVQEHLAVCQRCRDLILDFASFVETPLDKPQEGVADLMAEAEWRKVRERLGPRVQDERPRHIPLRIAASLLLVVLAGSLIGVARSNGKLRAQIAELQAPRLDMSSVRLEGTRGLAVSISSKKTTDLELSTSSPAKFSRYEIELAKEDGDLVWSRLVEKGEGGFHLLLLPGFPEPGLYRVRLSGVQGRQKELLESYSVRIER